MPPFRLPSSPPTVLILASALLIAPASAGPGSTESAHAAGNESDARRTAQEGRADQVYVLRKRTGAVVPVNGVVVRNELDGVVIEVKGKERRYDAEVVRRIVFGSVPPAFREATFHRDRSEHENAARKFRLAAGDASARQVVQASARLEAAVSFLQAAAEDPVFLDEAGADLDRFLSDHQNDLGTPHARTLRARVARLAGKQADAAEHYRGIYREASGGTPAPGYSLVVCASAGIEAAACFLETGNTAQARELYLELDRLLNDALGTIEEDDPDRNRMEALRGDARLGEGFCLLAGNNATGARSFFQALLGASSGSGAGGGATVAHGARLGLAEALEAAGEYRQAQMEFALVSSIDHTNRDRSARALIGLSRCGLQLADANSRTTVRRWLEAVTSRYGDTPGAAVARTMLESL